MIAKSFLAETGLKNVVQPLVYQGTAYRPKKGSFVATVSLSFDDKANYKRYHELLDFNSDREYAMRDVLEYTRKNTNTTLKLVGGTFLFPAGWFQSGKNPAAEMLEHFSSLAQISTWGDGPNNEPEYYNNVVCFGIDGGDTEVMVESEQHGKYMDIFTKDQLAVAVHDDKGILAVGRKFFPTQSEKMILDKASDFMVEESGYSRIFEHNGTRFYMGVCYDGFGVRKKNLENPGADVFFDLIHRFNPASMGNSGNVYFARHGLAGASKQWGVPAFGASTFFRRPVPETWPTGIFYDGPKPTHIWTYADNQITCDESFTLKTDAGIASIKVYSI
jgi:hypothetical protein